jgi:hypothetical protein
MVEPANPQNPMQSQYLTYRWSEYGVDYHITHANTFNEALDISEDLAQQGFDEIRIEKHQDVDPIYYSISASRTPIVTLLPQPTENEHDL